MPAMAAGLVVVRAGRTAPKPAVPMPTLCRMIPSRDRGSLLPPVSLGRRMSARTTNVVKTRASARKSHSCAMAMGAEIVTMPR